MRPPWNTPLFPPVVFSDLSVVVTVVFASGFSDDIFSHATTKIEIIITNKITLFKPITPLFNFLLFFLLFFFISAFLPVGMDYHKNNKWYKSKQQYENKPIFL